MGYFDMPIAIVGSYVAGFASGWLARSAVTSSREVVVRTLVFAQALRDGVRRVVAEQGEWFEDLFAESKARYQASRVGPVADARARPHVANDVSRPRAA